MSTDAATPPSNKKHTASVVAICLASALSGAVGFEVREAHVVRRLGDACPWDLPHQNGHPVRVGAAIALGAGLLALLGLLLRRTNYRWWAVLAAATITVGVVGGLAVIEWFFIGNCFG